MRRSYGSRQLSWTQASGSANGPGASRACLASHPLRTSDLEDSATGWYGSLLRNVHPEGTPDAGPPRGVAGQEGSGNPLRPGCRHWQSHVHPLNVRSPAGLGLAKSVTLTTLADQLCLCLCPFRSTWRRRGPTSAPGTGQPPGCEGISDLRLLPRSPSTWDTPVAGGHLPGRDGSWKVHPPTRGRGECIRLGTSWSVSGGPQTADTKDVVCEVIQPNDTRDGPSRGNPGGRPRPHTQTAARCHS